MESSKIIIIVNPKSGSGSKNTVIERIDKFFTEKKAEYSIIQTEYAGHAEKIAKEYAGKVRTIVAVGGDGTVNEIARGIRDSETALAIIPYGSGNGLARDLCIPMRLSAALKTITNGDKILIDYGLINEHPFFCTCGTGFDASVSLKFADSNKRGLLTYIEKTLTEWLNYSPIEYELTIDDNAPQKIKAFLIACANASQYGNNAYIAPEADITDGIMDVTIVLPFNVWEIPGLVVQLFTNTIDKNSKIKTFKCRKLHISGKDENPAHFDGDPIILSKEIDVEIINKGLHVIIPNEKDKKDRFKYSLSQRYDITIKDIQHCTEYIEDANEKLEKQIKKHNDAVLGFIKKTNDDILNSIKNLLNK